MRISEKIEIANLPKQGDSLTVVWEGAVNQYVDLIALSMGQHGLLTGGPLAVTVSRLSDKTPVSMNYELVEAKGLCEALKTSLTQQLSKAHVNGSIELDSTIAGYGRLFVKVDGVEFSKIYIVPPGSALKRS